ncbi:MAG: metal-sulfur cluster assembly factor [Calditrichaceae bacterium]
MTTEQEIVESMMVVYDPEIRVNIVDLGLIYSVDLEENGHVKIRMTLTSPGCPVSGQIERDIKKVVRQQDGVQDVEIEFVWDPPWGPAMMSDEAKLMLGYDVNM